MARINRKQALTIFGLGKVAEGVSKGVDTLTDIMSKRALMQMQQDIEKEKEKKKSKADAFETSLKIRQYNTKQMTPDVDPTTGLQRTDKAGRGMFKEYQILPDTEATAYISELQKVNPNIPSIGAVGEKAGGSIPSPKNQALSSVMQQKRLMAEQA